MYPARQRQEKSGPRSSQVPPFMQGLRKQGEGAARTEGVIIAVSSPKTSRLHGSSASHSSKAGHLCPLGADGAPRCPGCAAPSWASPLASAHLTYLAVPPREAWGTVTLVFANVVEAGAAVVAGARGTGVRLPWKQKAPMGVRCHAPTTQRPSPDRQHPRAGAPSGGSPDKQTHGGWVGAWLPRSRLTPAGRGPHRSRSASR